MNTEYKHTLFLCNFELTKLNHTTVQGHTTIIQHITYFSEKN